MKFLNFHPLTAKSLRSFINSQFNSTESKNQEVAEQDANGGAKNDLTALQNHNLLIALAHGANTSGGSPFAMPVSLKLFFKILNKTVKFSI